MKKKFNKFKQSSFIKKGEYFINNKLLNNKKGRNNNNII